MWDLDGRKYVNMASMGIGACILGYADRDVNEAVRTAVDCGSMTTLNCPEEVELAELLCELHPWASMVRYARGGGEAMAVAVRVARAAGRARGLPSADTTAGTIGTSPRTLATAPRWTEHLLPGLDPAGVPRGLRGTALPFRYNHLEELEAIVAEHGAELAAIVMEPIRNAEPQPDFLTGVRGIASRLGAVLIVDEVTAGWRLRTGGAHLEYGLTPDMAVFAKGISNGYPLAAIIGIAEVMKAFQSTFISSTYWTERIGPTAGLATLRKHRRLNVARPPAQDRNADPSRLARGRRSDAFAGHRQRHVASLALRIRPPGQSGLAHALYADHAGEGLLGNQRLLCVVCPPA